MIFFFCRLRIASACAEIFNAACWCESTSSIFEHPALQRIRPMQQNCFKQMVTSPGFGTSWYLNDWKVIKETRQKLEHQWLSPHSPAFVWSRNLCSPSAIYDLVLFQKCDLVKAFAPSCKNWAGDRAHGKRIPHVINCVTWTKGWTVGTDRWMEWMNIKESFFRV